MDSVISKVLFTEEEIAAFNGVEACDHTKQGGFAAAGGAQQREEFMVIEVKIDAVENTLPVELHGKIPEPDEFFGHYPPPFLFEKCVDYDNYRYTPKSPLCQRNFLFF